MTPNLIPKHEKVQQMKLGFLDFEATSIDPTAAHMIEYAFMVYDTDIMQPVKIKTDLVKIFFNIPDEVVDITGITTKMVTDHGVTLNEAVEEIQEGLEPCDYIVAHNGLDYDKILWETEAKKVGVTPRAKPWIDTRYDLPIPDKIKERKLTHLAAAHGFVNPMAHRALSDVLTLQHLTKMYPLDEVIKIASTPLISIRAEVTFSGKEEAKKRGYYWNPENKTWWKKIRECFLQKEMKAPFRVVVLQ